MGLLLRGKSTEVSRLKTELKQKERLLEEKSTEVVNYLYTITHELKAPIISIRGFSNILNDYHKESLDEETRHYLGRISDNIDKMERLIDDLARYAKVNVHREECDWISIRDVIDEAIANVRYLMVGKAVRIDLSGTFPSIFCHRVLLTSVFTNLLSNAIKYAKKQGEVLIEIGYLDTEIFHKFFVKDNGVGIPTNKMDQLFVLFKRLHENKNIQGSGIGLAVTKRIIEGHGGEIWAESVHRKGSAFYFTLPR
jgi:signal transduction histidine kinase